MDKKEAIQRAYEALDHLHNLANMLRDDYPDRAERIHLFCWHLRRLKDQLLEEMEEEA